ncbi:MAG: alanyl-tRNA editing protein [Sandaracinaceae bacterium]|nr:alanyl-tRNA editing protein [Sandaracinaceae bacterium]
MPPAPSSCSSAKRSATRSPGPGGRGAVEKAVATCTGDGTPWAPEPPPPPRSGPRRDRRSRVRRVTTERLHYDDPLLLSARVRVLAHAVHEGQPSVVLDRTPFYPESGGQLGDQGTLGDARVLDVQLDDDGRVHHLVEGPLPAVGDELDARVDEPRRRTHMALHSGQHALSRALLDRLGAATRSSRLGATACTIDVDVAGLDLEALAPVAAAVNRLIDEDRPVRQRFVDDDELSRLALRKPAAGHERVRVVEIEGWDTTPCGGTHVTHTAQIELVEIERVEGYKGGSRITFEAGPRARARLLDAQAALRAAARRLDCAPPEVPSILDGAAAKLAAAREEAGALRARLAELWAARLDGGDGAVVATIDGGDPALLKAIAARLATGARLVALAAPSDAGTDVVFARGPEARVGCGELLRAVAAACGGRGGGRPDHAQGRLPAGIEIEALVRAQLLASSGLSPSS